MFVKNDLLAFLSLTKIRNILKIQKFVNKSEFSNESVDFYNFNYIKISKKRNKERKKRHDPHYSAQVWELLAKYCKIIVIIYQTFILQLCGNLTLKIPLHSCKLLVINFIVILSLFSHLILKLCQNLKTQRAFEL